MVQSGRVEVVVFTHNHPRALDLALRGLSLQTTQRFRICVADDGSGPSTRAVVDAWAATLGPRLRHVWHTHRGPRKNRILNKAIATASADYLIFLDGDCVPGRCFVQRHLELGQPGRFCTGGVIRLDPATSDRVDAALVQSGEVFSPAWLRAHRAMGGLGACFKAGALPAWLSGLAEVLTPVRKTWNGDHSSTWRMDLIRINGFDENFGYGTEDTELGYRLNNAGVRGRHLRYTAPVLRLERPREAADPDSKARHKETARQALRAGKTVSGYGIEQL